MRTTNTLALPESHSPIKRMTIAPSALSALATISGTMACMSTIRSWVCCCSINRLVAWVESTPQMRPGSAHPGRVAAPLSRSRRLGSAAFGDHIEGLVVKRRAIGGGMVELWDNPMGTDGFEFVEY